jgi:hypothetical protein
MAEAALLRMRTIIVLCVLLGLLAFVSLKWRGPGSRNEAKETSAAIVNKLPVHFANRTFDPASPPPEMPPMTPGEAAVCDSNFVTSANVSGDTYPTDATHASVTVTQVKVKLQLNITIWTPGDVSQRVMEHENGHRQISEHYYETDDKVAEQIAATYLGRQTEISGANLDAEAGKLLQQMAAVITAEYGKRLNPEPAQLLYDTITDHNRNEVSVRDAVTHAINNAAVEAN